MTEDCLFVLQRVCMNTIIFEEREGSEREKEGEGRGKGEEGVSVSAATNDLFFYSHLPPSLPPSLYYNIFSWMFCGVKQICFHSCLFPLLQLLLIIHWLLSAYVFCEDDNTILTFIYCIAVRIVRITLFTFYFSPI